MNMKSKETATVEIVLIHKGVNLSESDRLKRTHETKEPKHTFTYNAKELFHFPEHITGTQ
jgi:hypothetical protein